MIVQIKFGSHLYGTETSQSDLDIKAVYLPSARDILLQRVAPIISTSRIKKEGEKNTSEDIDSDSYSLGQFLYLLAQGQPVALDMLFAPQSAMLTTPDPLWVQIQTKIAPKILNRNAKPILSYCRRQANKYGIKGSRIASAKAALDLLTEAIGSYGSSETIAVIENEIEKVIPNNEFLALGQNERDKYFEICGRKALFKASLKSAHTIAQNIVSEYEERSNNMNIDWKALSHAVRVGHQAIEFFTMHKVTFPRPEAAHLIDIKQGKLPYKQVAEEIEDLLEKVEKAANQSTLPITFNTQVIDDFIVNVYRGIVIANR